MKNTIKILFLFLLLIAFESARAQYGETADDQKGKLLYQIPTTLMWENDENIDVINIGVVQGSESLLKSLRKEAKRPYGNGTRVVVKTFEDVSSAYTDRSCHVLYLPDAVNYKLALAKFKLVAVALVSDNYTDKKNVQINFVNEKSGKVAFQFSSANLRKVGISVHENIFKELHGEDISKDDIISDKENQLKSAESKLASKQKELDQKQKEVDEKEREIIQKQQKIEVQDRNIALQSRAINDQKLKLEQQKAEMQKLVDQQDEARLALEQSAREPEEKNNEVKSVADKLRLQQAELKEQQIKAKQQAERIERINKEISAKELELTALNAKNVLLNNILMVAVIVGLIFVVMTFFILMLYRSKRKDNIKLEQQNNQIEQQKQELEKLSIVADKTSTAVMILDRNGNFEWINEGFTRMYGFSLEELCNQLGSNILQASQNSHIEKVIDTVKTQKQSMLYENQVITKSGEKKYAQTSITPVLDNDNNVTKLILIDSDITALKQAHEEIRQQKDKIESQKELLEQNNKELEKLSLVASKTDNSVIIAQSDGEIEWVNEGFSRMTGYSFDEYASEHGTNLLQKNTSQDVLDRIEHDLIERRSTIYTTKSTNKNGQELWIQTNLTPIFNQNELYKIVAIDSDITQIKKQEEEIQKQKDKIVESILYASRIQQAVMPTQSLFDSFLPEHFIMLKPRDIVSGDFYWGTHLGDLFLFTAADCTGHGVPGAFMSLLGIAFLNEIVGHKSQETVTAGEILTELRAHVMQYLGQEGKEDEQKDGMDMALCIYDKKNNKIQYAGAHNPLILIRNGELTQYDADEMPIGYYANQTEFFTNQIIDIQHGDMIYMFSDGYVDQFGMLNGKRKKFMIKRFRDYLLEIHKEDCGKQKTMLDNTIEEYRGNIKQMDDILVIGARL